MTKINSQYFCLTKTLLWQVMTFSLAENWVDVICSTWKRVQNQSVTDLTKTFETINLGGIIGLKSAVDVIWNGYLGLFFICSRKNMKKLLIFCEKGFFPRALLTISHHDKLKAKCVQLGAHLAIAIRNEIPITVASKWH